MQNSKCENLKVFSAQFFAKYILELTNNKTPLVDLHLVEISRYVIYYKFSNFHKPPSQPWNVILMEGIMKIPSIALSGNVNVFHLLFYLQRDFLIIC